MHGRVWSRKVELRCSRNHVYVCGPVRLNEAVESAAAEAGWDLALIHREYFAAGAIDHSQDTPFDLRIASTGAMLHVPADKSIVEVLSDAGIEIPVSCSEGVCGTCITRVLEGEIVHRDLILSPEQRSFQDQMTPCCSRAASKMLGLDL
jgi:vanillate O-demethylase ferredoxin subunit